MATTSPISARRRIAAWILLTTGLTLLALLLTLRSLMHHDVDHAANTAISQETEEFASFTREGKDPRTGEAFTSLKSLFEVYLSRQHPNEGEAIVGVSGGKVQFQDNSRARTSDGAVYELPRHREVLQAIQSSPEPGGVIATPAGDVRWGKVDVAANREEGHLIVVEFTSVQQERNDHILFMATMISLGGLVLTSAIAWVVAGQILEPIRSISRTARKISESDISLRVPVRSRDDVGELAESFNAMLDRLERAQETQRQFIDDASHELRTPLTAIRGQLELLDEDPVSRRETLHLVDQEISRMGRIVGDLLLIARSERPDFIQPREVDLAEFMVELEGTLQGLDSRPWVLEDAVAGTARVDAERLKQALLQYAANALQYSPEGSPVRFGSRVVEREGVRMLDFWVRDEGPGIAEDQRSLIFDRFSRADQLKDRHDGFGLGLAIVRGIAHAHGGAAWVESELGEGSSFGLEFPLSVIEYRPDTEEVAP
ncbi:HAMP domain-containing sensor histidine kinase [Falsarthrobacter nasiphocae]|uniref:histidine kinase n=1 Tax=Falsarthrobacter nasiphocae TaxID=189863 RepID=A0AAE3YGJ2_9MICC|nr:HAMP domain-containing sensor histidine kinase [Falsarthrobacter nasiphocae]MDR6891754.1 signal transduction histidine kinase [Falsarthrobacter nasiphocae]